MASATITSRFRTSRCLEIWAVDTNTHFVLKTQIFKFFLQGAVDIDLKWNFLSMYKLNTPLSPPIPYFPSKFSLDLDIPVLKDMPIGFYNLNIKFYNYNKEKIQCINVSYRLF